MSIADRVYFSAAYKPVQCTQTANGFVLIPKSSHSTFASSRICGYSSVGRHFTHFLPFAVWCQDWYPFKVDSMKHAIFRDNKGDWKGKRQPKKVVQANKYRLDWMCSKRHQRKLYRQISIPHTLPKRQIKAKFLFPIPFCKISGKTEGSYTRG